ncbi:hypothetical protein SGPA1_40678 [Streptomyces misionensis JCM 4497]
MNARYLLRSGSGEQPSASGSPAAESGSEYERTKKPLLLSEVATGRDPSRQVVFSGFPPVVKRW